VVGSFEHEGANQVISEADTLLVVGCRLNPMDTNWQAPSFIRPGEQTIVHADVDARNAGWVYPADVGLVGDAHETLTALAGAVPGEGTGDSDDEWALDRATAARADFSPPACESDAKASDVATVIDVRIDPAVEMVETLQPSFYAEVGGLHDRGRTDGTIEGREAACRTPATRSAMTVQDMALSGRALTDKRSPAHVGTNV